jgi:hypothetical protein
MARNTYLMAMTVAANYSGAGTQYVVETPGGVTYVVYVGRIANGSAGGVEFVKSSDGGVTWDAPVTVFSTNGVTQLSIWYDRWSSISAGLIHCAYISSAGDDVFYRSIDTESSDALSTETTIVALLSTAGGGALSITRARGGNLYCKATIDAGAEGGFFRSTDVGATWGSRTDSEALATTDQWILMPGWAADNQDIMMFFWDASADEISRVLNDDSANSWAETSIAGTMLDTVATSQYPHFAAAVDTTNSRNLLVAWSAVDAANADLRCWHVTESAITEVTNVVLNSTDDQGLCAIGIDTDTQDWYVFYGGNSDGDETYNNVSLRYKVSTDDGSTWGSETQLINNASLVQIYANPRSSGFPAVAAHYSNSVLLLNADEPTVGGGSGGAHILGGTVVR